MAPFAVHEALCGGATGVQAHEEMGRGAIAGGEEDVAEDEGAGLEGGCVWADGGYCGVGGWHVRSWQEFSIYFFGGDEKGL